MNADQLDGTLKNAAGKVQDAVGGLTGDLDLQAEGKVRQLSGQAQAKYGESVGQIVVNPARGVRLARPA
jgi:uncharacterized protein YjbJ (UPF0337 family)